MKTLKEILAERKRRAFAQATEVIQQAVETDTDNQAERVALLPAGVFPELDAYAACFEGCVDF